MAKRKVTSTDVMRINFGCGVNAPQTWVNFDSSPTLIIQRIPWIGGFFRHRPFSDFPLNVRRGDVVKGLPVEKGKVDLVYSSHVIEHLALADADKAFENVHSYLRPGGVFRFVMPDLRKMAEEYVGSRNPGAAVKFMKTSRMGKEDSTWWSFLIDWCGHRHRWLWDYASIEERLSCHGFVDIKRAEFGDSFVQRFSEVELEDQWTGRCLGVECRKSYEGGHP